MPFVVEIEARCAHYGPLFRRLTIGHDATSIANGSFASSGPSRNTHLASGHEELGGVHFSKSGYPVDEEALMGDSVETTCFRCATEIVVMTASEYLSITNADLDFVLHARAHESVLAIKSANGAYTCPTCGHHDRMPPQRRVRAPLAKPN